jgi:FkbM family methyltransferase
MFDPLEHLPSSRTVVGRLLRLPLRLIPRDTRVPVLAGPMAGLRWIAGSGPHSIWLGVNELAMRRRFSREVRTGDVVFDVGANVGSYSLLASRLCGPSGKVVAFEPLPANLEYLNRHIVANALTNVVVVPAAVSDHRGRAAFHGTQDRVTSRLASDGDIQVDCVTLDELVAVSELPPPDCIKIDVEGEEAAVLRGAATIVQTKRPIIFLETHGADKRAECTAFLEHAGYRLELIEGDDRVLIARPSTPRSRD